MPRGGGIQWRRRVRTAPSSKTAKVKRSLDYEKREDVEDEDDDEDDDVPDGKRPSSTTTSKSNECEKKSGDNNDEQYPNVLVLGADLGKIGVTAELRSISRRGD